MVSVQQAQDLVRRVGADPDFKARLESADLADRRAILEAEGFGDVRLSHLAHALPVASGGELSDEEFAAVAGGDSSSDFDPTTATISIGVGVAAIFVVGAV